MTVQAEPLTAEAVKPARSGLAVFRPLKSRNFVLVWLGESVSILGDQFHFVALSLLVLNLTQSGLALGTVLAVAGIPRAALMLLGGAVTDRFSPRLIMLYSNGIRTVLTLLLAGLALTGLLQLWHVYVIVFIFGIVSAFFYPAYSSILPTLVEKEEIEAGNALMQITARVAMLVGPVVAGLVVARIQAGAALGFDALTFAVATVALLAMRNTAPAAKVTPSPESIPAESEPQEAPAGLVSAIREALRYAWNDSLLRTTLIMIALVDFSVAGVFGVGLPTLADMRYGGAEALGIMFSGFGAGSVLGVLLAGSIKFQRRGRLFILLLVLFTVSVAGMGFAPDVTSLALLTAIIGLGSGIFNVTGISWLQVRTDPKMMGRIMSLLMFSSAGLQPVANTLAGVLVEYHLTTLFLGAGLLTFLAVLVTAANREFRTLH
ncbi:MAG: MFS transporter [Anaerolineaceae bacterium]|nr:MFS transporter [Anaerolineaceae bacterium]